MESTTKTHFSPETIASLVQAHFGTAAAIAKIEALTAGWFNTAYRIDFNNGDPGLVLRIAPHPEQRVLTYERELMRKELQVYSLLAGHPELRAPRLLAADTSRRLIERDFMFTEQLQGQALDTLQPHLSQAAKDEIEAQLGSLMAAMHQVTNPAFGYFGAGPGAGSPTWRAAFTAFVAALLADGEALQVEGIPYLEIQGLVTRYGSCLEAIRTPRLVHWDLWAGNVFVRPAGESYQVEGLIDWERTFWGDPEAETALCCRFYGPAFFGAYGRELATGQEAEIRQALYRLYLWLIMLIEDKVRFGGADHIPWVRMQFEKDLDWLRAQ
ncbi:MAG: aminoglycoside phosphotransferase family protein [Anaerolineales bacterium]|nr:aminoglycoside phosphotransferase family protein [Anaerolineales bacterium]